MTALNIATEWTKYALIMHAITQKFVILQNWILSCWSPMLSN